MKNLSSKKARLLRKLQPQDESYIPGLAVVGRVKSWLEQPESRYPQSCTVMAVEDSMEGMSGIEYSWLYVSKCLRYGAGVALDLSKLRPKGSTNSKGLVASGVCSFMEIYSQLNEVLRRGGVYKNGAVVAYLNATHADISEFISYPKQLCPWLKKAVYVIDDPDSPDYFLNNPHLDEILSAVRNGDIWLAKIRWEDPETGQLVNKPIRPDDPYLFRVFSNVCLEILLQSRGTCLLSHVNLGKCNLSNLVTTFTKSMRFLCDLHEVTGAGKDNYYLPKYADRQVGLGVVGLANMLANMEISYEDFADCLYDWFTNEHIITLRENGASLDTIKSLYPTKQRKVIGLVSKFEKAFAAAAKVARKRNMVRAFTIAPTATSSYNHVDINGYTLTPEISPPICHPETKSVTRDSDTNGIKEYFYPPKVETAEQVGWETYYKLVKGWQLLMNSTGLAHSISFNVWNQCPVDREFIEDWLKSPLVTTYYRMVVDQSFTDKSNIEAGLDSNLVEETQDFFDFSFTDLSTPPEKNTEDKSNTILACSLDNFNNNMECSACAD